MRVYKNEKGWSEFIKNEYNGITSKCYMSVTFAKDCGEPNPNEQGYADIIVPQFMHSCYPSKEMNADGTYKGIAKIIVIQWDYLVVEKKKEQPKSVQTSAFERYGDEELPF